jgi:hypothetical protein
MPHSHASTPHGLGASAAGPLGSIGLMLGVAIVVAGVVALRRNEGRWEQEATRAMTTAHDAGPDGRRIEAAA